MTIENPTELEDDLARGVIHLANKTSMTTHEWHGDEDVRLALDVLGWSVDQAKTS